MDSSSAYLLEGEVLEELQPYLGEFVSTGFSFVSYQHAVKQAALVRYLHMRFLDQGRPLKILDIGGGEGPLCYFATAYGEVTNVDTFERPMWPVVDHYPVALTKPEGKYRNVHFIKATFQEFYESSPRAVFDVIVDSCSLIHFGGYGTEKMSGMLKANSHRIADLLAPGGRFISATDVASDHSWQFKDFLYLRNFVSALTSEGRLTLSSRADTHAISREMPKQFFAWFRNERYQGRTPLYTLVAEGETSLSRETLKVTSPTIFHGFGRLGVVSPVAFLVFKLGDEREGSLIPKARPSLTKPFKFLFHVFREFYRFQILEGRLFQK